MCWAGLAGQEAGLMGLKGKAENLLGLTIVSYPAQTEIQPTRPWRSRGLLVVKEVMAKRELDHELTYCL